MKRIVAVVGTRPNFLKLDVDFPYTAIINTGQHFDPKLSDAFFDGLIVPKPTENLGETELGPMVTKLLEVLPKYQPHYVWVAGDTRSSLAGALAAHQLNIPLIHVEAGCRSGNYNMIEERNRILIDHISQIHLAPSFKSVFNLENEGINPEGIYNVGCANFSALMRTLPSKREIEEPYCLLTLHRAENTDSIDKIKEVFNALESYEKLVLFPVHPRTRPLLAHLVVPKNIRLLDPLPYKEFIHKMGFATWVITDSGGVQAEAYLMRTPCITLREETEWKETVDEGWNKLVGTDAGRLLSALRTFKVRKDQHSSYSYGLGNTNEIIRSILSNL